MSDLLSYGIVKFFNVSKGYGFIVEDKTKFEYFFHVTKVINQVKKDDKVTFTVDNGKRGPQGINVKKY